MALCESIFLMDLGAFIKVFKRVAMLVVQVLDDDSFVIGNGAECADDDFTVYAKNLFALLYEGLIWIVDMAVVCKLV